MKPGIEFGIFNPIECTTDSNDVVASRYREIVDQAVLADRLGFDTYWIAENHFSTLNGVCPCPPVLLSAIAMRTGRIQLGAAVCVLPLHHPLDVAEQYAMVDCLSDGRLVMALGTGFAMHLYEGYGVAYETRRPLFDEALKIFRAAWMGRAFSFTGEFYALKNVRLNVIPSGSGSKKLWISCSTVERAKSIALQDCNVLLSPFISNISQSTLRELCSDLRSHGLGEVGIVLHCLVSSNPDAVEIGTGAFRTRLDRLVQYGEFGGRFKAVPALIRRAQLEKMLLFGSPAGVSECLKEWINCGVNHIYLIVDFGSLSPIQIKETTSLLGERVLPELRKPFLNQ